MAAEEFWELERDSRTILVQVIDLCKRREASFKNADRGLVTSCYSNFVEALDAWIVKRSEEALKLLRAIVADLSILRRKLLDRDQYSKFGLAVEQEFYRKLELLDTLKSLGDYNPENCTYFYRDVAVKWACDSEHGCVKEEWFS